MSFYLLDHPNPNGPNFYDNRRVCQHGLQGPHVIVIHTAENLPDFTPPDTGGESIAAYAKNTARAVSWHSTVDSDSIIPMLPDTYTGWHVRGYNRCALGLELATQAHKWVGSPYEWRVKILTNAAKVCAEWSERWNIPLDVITKAQVDAGQKGVTTHSRLDPTRRSDPGPAFPMNFMLAAARSKPEPPPFTDSQVAWLDNRYQRSIT